MPLRPDFVPLPFAASFLSRLFTAAQAQYRIPRALDIHSRPGELQLEFSERRASCTVTLDTGKVVRITVEEVQR